MTNEPTGINAEAISRMVHAYARRKAFDRHAIAVKRGIINNHQADALMAIWDEQHPYEPLHGEHG